MPVYSVYVGESFTEANIFLRGNNNKDEDKNPKTLNDKNLQASS